MEASTAVGKAKISQEEFDIAMKAVLDGQLPEGFGAADDADLMAREIAARIFEADSFEAAFSPQELPSWRDTLLGVPVLVMDLKLNPSTAKTGEVYAVVTVSRLDSGESLQVSTGGKNVVAQLLVAVKNGWTDRPVKMVTKRTAAGYDALWLVSAVEDAAA